tara:strand:- start:840 stop:1661 length:822 start_codon:yes stop_codon:yes gene_type:complete
MDNLVINVNSKFADLTKYTSSNFVYHLNYEIKNVAYIKLGSIEFPGTDYNYLERKKNISFKIGDGTFEETVTLEEGNYTSDTIISNIQSFLDTININRTKNYTIDINVNTGKVFFNSDDSMNIDFSYESVGYSSLGNNLGFTNNTYTGSRITADKVINLNAPLYYFLKINNIDNVIDNKVTNAFAKIIQTSGKYDFTIEGKQDYVSKEKVFRSPINLSKLEIQVVDFLDNILDFNGYDITLTLEVGFIYDKKLYESINNKGLPNGDNRLKYYY